MGWAASLGDRERLSASLTGFGRSGLALRRSRPGQGRPWRSVCDRRRCHLELGDRRTSATVPLSNPGVDAIARLPYYGNRAIATCWRTAWASLLASSGPWSSLTRRTMALLAKALLVTAEPGERRRARYRRRSAPMQVAQQFLARWPTTGTARSRR
jgi:hypothetical protein